MKIENIYNDAMPIIYGTLSTTGEKCAMQANGFWYGERGRRITSYIRVDTCEPAGISRQYSMDRKHVFYIETEDKTY